MQASEAFYQAAHVFGQAYRRGEVWAVELDQHYNQRGMATCPINTWTAAEQKRFVEEVSKH
jgi:hypothetical protein